MTMKYDRLNYVIMMGKRLFSCMLLLTCSFHSFSCSDDDNPGGGTEPPTGSGLNIPIQIPLESYESNKAPQSGLFFKNQPAANVSVFDISKDDPTAQLISCAIQGVLNQQTAQVYLNIEEHNFDQLKEFGGDYTVIPGFDDDKYAGLGAIVKKYKDNFDKLVVWDEGKEWTWCLAQMIAAQGNGMPVTPAVKDFIVE